MRLKPRFWPWGKDKGGLKTKRLGGFEIRILNAVMSLGDDASGPRIHGIIEKAEGWPVSMGAMYTTLERLISQGQLESWVEESTERGVKPVVYYRVTPQGRITMDALAARRQQNTRGIAES